MESIGLSGKLAPPGIACTLRGLFTLFRPILPEARGKKNKTKKKQGAYRFTRQAHFNLCVRVFTHSCSCMQTNRRLGGPICASSRLFFSLLLLLLLLLVCLPVWSHRRRSVCDFTSLAGLVSRSSDQRLFPCNYCPVNRSGGLESSHSCCSFQQLTHAHARTLARTPQPPPHNRPRPVLSEWY